MAGAAWVAMAGTRFHFLVELVLQSGHPMRRSHTFSDSDGVCVCEPWLAIVRKEWVSLLFVSRAQVRLQTMIGRDVRRELGQRPGGEEDEQMHNRHACICDRVIFTPVPFFPKTRQRSDSLSFLARKATDRHTSGSQMLTYSQ